MPATGTSHYQAYRVKYFPVSLFHSEQAFKDTVKCQSSVPAAWGLILSWYNTAHSPWYRTVLRGTGFQLRPSDFSHPTRNTRSKTFIPPMAPMTAPVRRNWRWLMDRGINRLIRGTSRERAAKLLAACRETEKPTHQLKAAIHFFYWLGCLSETILSWQYLQLKHFFFKKPHRTVHTFKLHWKINYSLWKHVL